MEPRSIPARELRSVIRRAAELSLEDADPDDTLTEVEVIRIATELGLPARHVRQALFELPDLAVAPRWYDRWFDPAVITVTRVVPTQTDPVLRRVEDYLVTGEYLQIVRRRSDTIAFIPADDTLSSLARAFSRPNSRHMLARASRIIVGVHPMPDDAAHVRFDVDLSAARRGLLQTGAVSGTLLGLVVGSGAAAITALGLPDAGVWLHLAAFGSGTAATAAASVRVAATSFAGKVRTAKLELAGLLDRLEQGQRLDPPPAPWKRKLQLRLFGDRR